MQRSHRPSLPLWHDRHRAFEALRWHWQPDLRWHRAPDRGQFLNVYWQLQWIVPKRILQTRFQSGQSATGSVSVSRALSKAGYDLHVCCCASVTSLTFREFEINCDVAVDFNRLAIQQIRFVA